MFRLKEAMAYASAKRGKKITNMEIADIMFPDSKTRAKWANLRNLLNGDTKRVEIAQVIKLTEYLGVSADYLFGLTETPSYGIADLKVTALKVKQFADELYETTLTL